MEFRHLALFCLIAILGSHVHASSMAAQKYWQSIWPNTPMPKALQDLTKIGLWNGRPSPPGINRPAKVGRYKGIFPNININYGGSSETREDTRNLTTYFFENDLRPGKKFNLEFTKPSDEFTFLPQKIAKSIPFSSNKFSEILNYFGIQAKSAEAEMLKHTLEFCENPRIRGEDKYCASSLESLIDFTILKLGKNIRVLSTELETESEKEEKKEYSVEEGVEKAGDKAVVCHKLNYPYAVFYCHKLSATKVYSVSLMASDGTRAKALAVCHTDTESWNPKHMAFKVLKVKPGTVPICHFTGPDNLLWVPN